MTDTANLEDGFYWVCYDGHSEWTIAEKIGGSFYIRVEDFWFRPESLDEIDPRPIKRDDVK